MEGSLRVEMWERVFSKTEFISENELGESLCLKGLNRGQNANFGAQFLASRPRWILGEGFVVLYRHSGAKWAKKRASQSQ